MTEDHLKQEYPHAYPVLEMIAKAKTHGGLLVYDTLEGVLKDVVTAAASNTTTVAMIEDAVTRASRVWDV